jgi:hypothetical protein
VAGKQGRGTGAINVSPFYVAAKWNLNFERQQRRDEVVGFNNKKCEEKEGKGR